MTSPYLCPSIQLGGISPPITSALKCPNPASSRGAFLFECSLVAFASAHTSQSHICLPRTFSSSLFRWVKQFVAPASIFAPLMCENARCANQLLSFILAGSSRPRMAGSIAPRFRCASVTSDTSSFARFHTVPVSSSTVSLEAALLRFSPCVQHPQKHSLPSAISLLLVFVTCPLSILLTAMAPSSSPVSVLNGAVASALSSCFRSVSLSTGMNGIAYV